jgi:Tfp pilus assembly protein PilF
VRLWFGVHLISDYIGDQAGAARYEAAMRRRFPGLEVTSEVLAVTGRAVDYSPADLHR